MTRALWLSGSLLRRLDRDSGKFGEDGLPADTVAELCAAFVREGCRLDNDLRLHTARVARLTVHADALSEASGIHAELKRVRSVVVPWERRHRKGPVNAEVPGL
ncbi:MAG: hypothetical protein QOI83_271 [Streptomycetaceae bacterium]|nr:hypothetical protein [Streptomycetaceae bacterium]